jgi:excisionase family DNA binding protein
MRAAPKHPTRSNTDATSRGTDAGSPDPSGYSTTPDETLEPHRDEVLDVHGAAQLLRLGRNTIYELVGRNEIPHRRFGKQIRFSCAAIMRWLDPWSLQDAKERQ